MTQHTRHCVFAEGLLQDRHCSAEAAVLHVGDREQSGTSKGGGVLNAGQEGKGL